MALAAAVIVATGVSMMPGTARAESRAAGCSVVAFNPRVEDDYSVVATNDTTCHGPVRNVQVSVKLYQYKTGWYVAASKSARWGNVPVSRYGDVNAWIHPIPEVICYRYITQATVSWTFADGNPGGQTLSSPTVRLTLGTVSHQC